MSALFVPIDKGNLKGVKRLVTEGVDVNEI
jgi:hypothetical protein